MNDFIKDRTKLEDALFQNEGIMQELEKRYKKVLQAKKELWNAQKSKAGSNKKIEVLQSKLLKKQRSFIDCVASLDKERNLIRYVRKNQSESFINEMHSILLSMKVANAVYRIR